MPANARVERPAGQRNEGSGFVLALYCLGAYAAGGVLYAIRIFSRTARHVEPDDRAMSIGLAVLWPIALYLELTE